MNKQNNISNENILFTWKIIASVVITVSSICISALFVDSMEYTIFAGSLAGIVASPIVYILGTLCLFIVALFQGGGVGGANIGFRDISVLLFMVCITMMICIIYFGIPYVKSKMIMYKKEDDYKTKKKLAFMIGMYYGIMIFTMSIIVLSPLIYFTSKD